MENCIFCSIIQKKSPAKILYEDQVAIAIEDQHPLAPTHILIIPRRHVQSLNELSDGDENLLGHLLLLGRNLARQAGIAESGFRIVINTGPQAGQTVFHLHVHVLGGEPLTTGLSIKGLH